MTETILRTL